MQNRNPNKIKLAAAIFLKSAAQRPYRVFFCSLVIFAAAAAIIFLNCQKAGSFSETQKSAAGKNLFTAAKIKEYDKVFDSIKRRQENYKQPAGSDYPDVFGLSAPGLDSTTTEPAPELTKPEK